MMGSPQLSTPTFTFGDGIATKLGLSGLYLFAFSFSASSSGASLGLTLVLIGFMLITVRHGRWLIRDRIFQLNLLLCVYIVGLAAWSATQQPESAAHQWTSARELAMLSFPLVGIWIGQNEARARMILFVAAAGFVIELFYHAIPDWEDFRRAIHEDPIVFRYTFHKSAATIGLLSGTALLGLLVFMRALIGPSCSRLLFSLRLLAWMIAVSMVGYALLLSFSRASWLAFLLFTPITLLGVLRKLPARKQSTKQRGLGVTLVIAVLALSAFFLADKIEDRLAFEQDSYDKLLSGDVEALDDLSVGSRARMALYGLELWRSKPVFGWGPATTELMLDAHPHEALHKFDHLHNSYLEFAVRLGLAGWTLLLAITVLTARRLWQRYRAGQVSPAMFWFLFGSFGIFAVWSAFDIRLDHPDGRAHWLLLAGLMYGLGLPASNANPKTTEP